MWLIMAMAIHRWPVWWENFFHIDNRLDLYTSILGRVSLIRLNTKKVFSCMITWFWCLPFVFYARKQVLTSTYVDLYVPYLVKTNLLFLDSYGRMLESLGMITVVLHEIDNNLLQSFTCHIFVNREGRSYVVLIILH